MLKLLSTYSILRGKAPAIIKTLHNLHQLQVHYSTTTQY